MGGRDHHFQPRAAVPAAVTITSPSGSSADRTVGAKLQFAVVVQDDRGGTEPDAEIHWESSAPVTLQLVYDGPD